MFSTGETLFVWGEVDDFPDLGIEEALGLLNDWMLHGAGLGGAGCGGTGFL